MTRGRRPLLGVLVNPIAGMGGSVGLKGTDGEEILRRALALGALPRSPGRATRALRLLSGLSPLQIACAPDLMGARECREAGLQPWRVLEGREGLETTVEDTLRAARELRELGADLILFAGGDGTAADLLPVLGLEIPVVGIPAGVKMHSAVFGHSPEGAGELARRFLRGEIRELTEGEVMDLDEELLRQGIVSSRLLGYLRVPCWRPVLPGPKVAVPGRRAAREAIAAEVLKEAGSLPLILGPGTTTHAVLEFLGLQGTLVGVDVLREGRLVLRDAGEKALLRFLAETAAKVVVTPVGGQGFLLGRGNQPLTPAVLRQAGRDNLLVVATPEKLASLRGCPLRVDSGDPELDRVLRGYIRVITGPGQRVVYPVS